VGGEPKYEVTKNGIPVLKLNVAVNNSKKNDEGKWETVSTNWYNCVMYGDRADEGSITIAKGARLKITKAKYERKTWKNDKDEWKEANDVVIYEYEIIPKQEN
jgi:single-strand DNA-binding protein